MKNSVVKVKLNTIDVVISKALTNSNINHDKSTSVNMLMEYCETNEEISFG